MCSMIPPKNLNKIKLKLVLNYQSEVYESLIRKYPNYKADVIEIMVADFVYKEYGYDREAIRAGIIEYKIQDDPEFKDVLSKIHAIQENSFLNI
jgi:hypothetical protein